MQDIKYGKKIKDSLVSDILTQLKELLPSEKIIGIYGATSLKPMTDAIVLTESRLLAVTTVSFSGKRSFVKEVFGDEIEYCSVAKPTWGSSYISLKIKTTGNPESKYIDVRKDDGDEIILLLKTIKGTSPSIELAVNNKKNVESELKQISKDNDEADKNKWKSLVTGHVNNASLNEVKSCCRENELPEFILGEIGTGVLAVFSDRCVVIKKGLGTSFLASSLGGGRTASFAYRDITGIEYNSGIASGVLEILTPSYQGTVSTSPWAKRGKVNNAYELSNTLPWTKSFYNSVRPKIETIKHKIQESKRPNQQVSVQSSASLAEEISKLSALHKQGILSDIEFERAKTKLLSKI